MNKSEQKTLFLIFMIFIAACIETDIYLPAFPDMLKYFSASEQSIQRLLTWNFFGICLSGPLYGPISDAHGRKKPLLVALGIFFLGSLLTIGAETFEYMLLGRFLQGIGSGGCFTLGTAIIFDSFKGSQAIQAVNRMNTIAPFLIAAAPLVGGWLNYHYGFRANFFVIASFVLVSLLLSLFFFKEPLPREARQPFQLPKVFNDFKKAMTSLSFWQVIWIVSFSNGGVLTYLSGISVLFVLEFGVSREVLPLFQVSILSAWLAASLTCSRTLLRWGLPKVKYSGLFCLIIGALGFSITTWLTPDNAYFFTVWMMVYTFWSELDFKDFIYPRGWKYAEIKGVTAEYLDEYAPSRYRRLRGLCSFPLLQCNGLSVAAAVLCTVVIILPTILFYEKSRKASLV